MVAGLQSQIEWHEEAIEEEIEFAMEDRDDYSEETLLEILTEIDSPTDSVVYVQRLRRDLRDLRFELLAL